jgi:uncharacterized protein
MSVTLPSLLDAWRMVSARRRFEGSLPLSAMGRLAGSLHGQGGDARVVLEFDTDALKVKYLELSIDAELPLQCQRTLELFGFPVVIRQRLGLITREADEASLPEGYEPLLVGEDGALRPLELVEDELILALPVIPTKPGSEAVDAEWPADAGAAEDEPPQPHPFAALAALKARNTI